MSRTLITGFQPFHKALSNPSQAIVERIKQENIPDVYCEVLPVVFEESAELLLSKIEEIKPQIVIALGQAEGRTQITPERVAINIDDARIADNAGNIPVDKPIISGGPSAYFSTLPVKEIAEEIKRAGIPAAVSLSEGTLVCNHIFYQIQHFCRDNGIRSGFIHVPLMESQAPEFAGLPTMSLENMVQGIKIAIEVSRR